MFNAAIERISAHVNTLIKYPPQQKATTLSIGDMMNEILNSMPTDK
jgi:hypothetical protein